MHAEDTLRAGRNKGRPELVRLFVRQAPSALKWLIEAGGVKIREQVTSAPGHSAPRIHTAIDGTGALFLSGLRKIAEQNGARLRLNAQVTAIRRSGPSGPVTGVEVQHGKSRINLFIRQAPILASGGFSSDLAMRQAFNPQFGPEYLTTNHSGATGEVLRHARAIGAAVTQMDLMQVYPFADPATGRFDTPSVFALRGPEVGMIYVDAAGRRFVDETVNTLACSRAQILVGTDRRVTYALFNGAMISRLGTNMEVEKGVKEGRFYYGATLTELARRLHAPPETLIRTVFDHNGYIREGHDPDYQKQGLQMMIPLEHGPFFALPQWPAVHQTLGGLRINSRAQVLDARGVPIPRLYAAGEVTGAIHGTNRLAGNSIPECLVFGRIAGINAAEEKLIFRPG